MPKTAINPYITAAYTRKPPPGGQKTKPIQTQFKPNPENEHKSIEYK
jgi:hypothetical protein